MTDAGRPTLLQRQDIAHVVVGQAAGIEVRRGIGGLASCILPAGRAEALPDLDGLQGNTLVVTGFWARSENRPLIDRTSVPRKG